MGDLYALDICGTLAYFASEGARREYWVPWSQNYVWCTLGIEYRYTEKAVSVLLKKYSFIFILCAMQEHYDYMYILVSYVCSVEKAKKEVSNSLELELQMIASCQVSAGSWNLVLWKRSQWSYFQAISPAPSYFCLNKSLVSRESCLSSHLFQ